MGKLIHMIDENEKKRKKKKGKQPRWMVTAVEFNCLNRDIYLSSL
jgi:hypothetical protein